MRTRPVDAAALGLPRVRRGLELAGDLPPAPRLAIIGARAAHRRLLRLIPAILAVAARRGLSLISGGALGVDTAAHREALIAGVPQLAILPAAPEEPYPPSNLGLFAAIAARPGSGVAFALAPGGKPCRGLFASRNRYVVGMAAAVVVVEAALRSGSRGSGRLALRLGVPTAAVIGSPGCGALIGAGARSIPSDSPEAAAEAIEAWLADPTGAPKPDPWPPRLAGLAAALTEAGEEGLVIDDLEDPLAALVALTEADALGLVVEVAPGRYRRRDQAPGGRPSLAPAP
ncbi:MAG: DNA-processing protein DprA [Myxococcales bacterium]|nr:DNA-processing protein DprA [Myxococcales bacterium]